MPQPDVITLRVYGLPGAQGSKRAVGRGVMVESSKRVKPWRLAIISATVDTHSGSLIEGAVAVSIVFMFARPRGHIGARGLKASAPRHLASRWAGDIDKLCRSTLDGLSADAGGCLLRDDSQVVSLTAQKRYCLPDEPPGAVITVIPLP